MKRLIYSILCAAVLAFALPAPSGAGPEDSKHKYYYGR